MAALQWSVAPGLQFRKITLWQKRVGEAEDTWPVFLKDWQEGQWNRRYEQQTKSDMTRAPTPRFDLLHMDKYLYASIQISRGCPFTCEFCDIIVTFKIFHRLKTSAQVLAELESLRVLKMQQVFIVDDESDRE